MDELKYSIINKDDPDDAQKVERITKVRNTISTKVIERPRFPPDKNKNMQDTTARQSRTRTVSSFDTRRAQSLSPGPRGNSSVTNDDEDENDENEPPTFERDLQRAKSEGNLLSSDMTVTKLKKIRSFPSLERKVRFKSIDSEGYSLSGGDTTYPKRRSTSYDEWKKPSIEVKRKVQLLPQQDPSRRSRYTNPSLS